ncbi:hypothetical protein M5K25_009887 [Dendrobium thyrsiflorum]|uniref:Secreted protein n=1 Tax=Dendrobium thyrsiflorum TaxID=117978 RepID=A0ABD0V6X5_DENTH
MCDWTFSLVLLYCCLSNVFFFRGSLSLCLWMAHFSVQPGRALRLPSAYLLTACSEPIFPCLILFFFFLSHCTVFFGLLVVMHEGGGAGNDAREPAQDPSCRLCFQPGTYQRTKPASQGMAIEAAR